MNSILSKLIIYTELKNDEILKGFSQAITVAENEALLDDKTKEKVIEDIYGYINKLLVVATDYGFDKNLWHNYLVYLIINLENPFSITCEKTGASDGSVNQFALNDFENIMKLFNYDFSKVEENLGIDCFTTLTSYTSIIKKEFMYNKNVSEKVRFLSEKLENITSSKECFMHVTNFYRDYGVGMFGLNKAFRITDDGQEGFKLLPINNMDKVVLDDLIGYEIQKKKLVDNTEAFVKGRRANNCLLFGDSGTGKSTSIKAIVNQYYDQGLRMIEIYKHQFKYLSALISKIKNRNYKFIIYMDDLSFEEFEIEYKYLKAVIEGGMETKPDNILIYATSNRRHLIKENWEDRDDMKVSNGLHHSDTVEEKLSLVHRFGVTISYSKPTPKQYYDIAINLCRRLNVTKSDEEIMAEANKWELSHGGISGRTAQQFADYMAGISEYQD